MAMKKDRAFDIQVWKEGGKFVAVKRGDRSKPRPFGFGMTAFAAARDLLGLLAAIEKDKRDEAAAAAAAKGKSR